MGKKEITEFHITKRHILLVKTLKVVWNTEGVGAPMVDPKKPYGEGNIFEKVAEGLGVGLGRDKDGRTILQDGQIPYFNQCHKEMAIVLQICLNIGKFLDGFYVKENNQWIRKSKYPPKRRQ